MYTLIALSHFFSLIARHSHSPWLYIQQQSSSSSSNRFIVHDVLTRKLGPSFKLGRIPEECPSFRVETSCSIKRLLEDEELCCCYDVTSRAWRRLECSLSRSRSWALSFQNTRQVVPFLRADVASLCQTVEPISWPCSFSDRRLEYGCCSEIPHRIECLILTFNQLLQKAAFVSRIVYVYTNCTFYSVFFLSFSFCEGTFSLLPLLSFSSFSSVCVGTTSGALKNSTCALRSSVQLLPQ